MKATPIPLILALLGVLHAQGALADESIRFLGRSVQLDPYLAVSGSVFVDQSAWRAAFDFVQGVVEQSAADASLPGGQ